MNYKLKTIEGLKKTGNGLKKATKVFRPGIDIFTDRLEVNDYKNSLCATYDSLTSVNEGGRYPLMEQMMQETLKNIAHYDSIILANTGRGTGGGQKTEGQQGGGKKESATQYQKEAPRTATITVDQNFINQYLQNEKRSNEVFDKAIEKMYESTNVTQYAEKEKIKTIMENMKDILAKGEETKRSMSSDNRIVQEKAISTMGSMNRSYGKTVDKYLENSRVAPSKSSKEPEETIEIIQVYVPDFDPKNAKDQMGHIGVF